jgi:hypothetical protein
MSVSSYPRPQSNWGRGVARSVTERGWLQLDKDCHPLSVFAASRQIHLSPNFVRGED